MDQPVNATGTHQSAKAPWETYAAEMETKMSPELAAAVAAYAEHRYDDQQSSNQAKEELCYQQELNQGVAKAYQWLKPEEYDDIKQRIGYVLTHADVINKLRDLKVTCWYVQHPHPDKATLVVVRGTRPPEVACWVQLGYMPELSIMRFDEHGVPLDERRRGWRTCLLQLILKGIITETQAVKQFGYPMQTKAFDRYNRTLYEFRRVM